MHLSYVECDGISRIPTGRPHLQFNYHGDRSVCYYIMLCMKWQPFDVSVSDRTAANSWSFINASNLCVQIPKCQNFWTVRCLAGSWSVSWLLCFSRIGSINVLSLAMESGVKQSLLIVAAVTGFILCMHPGNERRRYNVTSSLIGWAHAQNETCCYRVKVNVSSQMCGLKRANQRVFLYDKWLDAHVSIYYL